MRLDTKAMNLLGFSNLKALGLWSATAARTPLQGP